MKGFTFKGRHTSEFGLIVNSVQRSLLPPLEAKTIKIPNRAGEYFFGTEKGMRTFDVVMAMPIKSSSAVWELVRDINAWLYSDEEEELIFDQEPTKSYYAFVSGESPLDKQYAYGAFSIKFVCPDPYAYGPDVESGVITASPTDVTIDGYEPTFPVITATFNQPSTFFTVATKDNHVHVGNPTGVDEVSVPKEVRKLYDDMSAVAPWVTHDWVDGGTVTGSFISDNYALKASSYGTGATWHGPCAKRMINDPIQNFKMEATVEFTSAGQKEVGRVEIYLLDQNGAVVGKILARDSWDDERTMIEAYAGDYNNGKRFMAFVGNVVKKKRKVTTKKKVKGKYVTTTTTVTDGFSTYANFHGMLRITRQNNIWKAYSAKIDPKTGKHGTRKTIHWTDKNNLYSDKVAGVAIHVGQYGTKPVVTTNRIKHITLTELNLVTSVDVPEIIDVGDVIAVDCETGAVLKNGEPFLEELDISSEFFPLSPGVNNVAFEPDDKCDIQVFHRGRYL